MDELTSQNPTSIQQMFQVISGKYDLANSVLSLGIHHVWKRKLIKKSKVQVGHAVLDCATGTGDLAFLFEKKVGPSGQVIGSDFCEPMLEVARQKASERGSKAKFEWADVMQLPYSDHQFDRASISFGIRNVKDPKKGLQELARVVKPRGKVLVLEFGQPQSKIIANLFNFYSEKVLPKIGGWISGQPQAYQYLQTSSAAFPCAQEFLKIAESTGQFASMRYVPLQFGIAYLYILERN